MILSLVIRFTTSIIYGQASLKWDGKMKFDYEFFLEWTSTALVIIGAVLTSLNIYPLNLAVQFVGNVGWFAVGYIWQKKSLMTIQAVISAIYITGLVSKGQFL
jgi:hypothetical protein